MDPYIEPSGYWGEFHTTLLTAMQARLNAVLPRRFRAHIDVYVTFQGPGIGVRGRRIEPDLHVSERADRDKRKAGQPAGAAPTTIVLPAAARRTKKSVLLLDRQARRVVTVIELLSPSNKEAGEDRDAYLHKRSHCLANRVSLVEIDLLRGGTRLPLSSPPPEIADYYVMVCRSWEYPRAAFWTFTIRQPLPEVPIPLASDVPDALLALRPCFDRAYDEASYDSELDYDEPLIPRPRKQDVAWIKSLLAKRPKTR
jgi:hypothetical protein